MECQYFLDSFGMFSIILRLVYKSLIDSLCTCWRMWVGNGNNADMPNGMSTLGRDSLSFAHASHVKIQTCVVVCPLSVYFPCLRLLTLALLN